MRTAHRRTRPGDLARRKIAKQRRIRVTYDVPRARLFYGRRTNHTGMSDSGIAHLFAMAGILRANKWRK